MNLRFLCGLSAWVCTVAWADQAADPHRASAHIDLQIRIPAVVRARPLTEPGELAIGADDLRRRYVDAQATIILTSNIVSGYRLSIGFDPRVLSRAVIRIQDQTLDVRAPQTSFHVLASKMTESQVPVAFRLYLAATAHEDIYRWPVRLEFSPGP